MIRHLHRVGLVESELPNGRKLRLSSNADDWVTNQVFWRSWQGYEPETVPLFFELAQKAGVTVDIGAYVGFFSLLAAHANSDGQVYSFEPLQPVFERLKANIALNKLKNVQVSLSAVGSETGTLEFYYSSETNLPTSSSLSFDFMKEADQLESNRVPVTTLDDFVRQNNIAQVDLIKIDTESTEPDVLEGARLILERDEPIIFCEVLKGRGSEKALEDILHSLGYEFHHLTPDGPVKMDHIEGHDEWLNYIFAKPHHHLDLT